METLETPDKSLTGEALREDTIRKAYMREGAITLYQRMLDLSETEETNIDD